MKTSSPKTSAGNPVRQKPEINFSVKESMLKALALVLFILLTSAGLQAQVMNELTGYLQQGKAAADPTALRIEALIFQAPATVMIRDGNISTKKEPPYVRVDTDVVSIGKLAENNVLFNQAELITIRINRAEDLGLVLNLDNLTAFTNLKYVYFLCSIDVSAEQIRTLIGGTYTGKSFFYLISVPN